MFVYNHYNLGLTTLFSLNLRVYNPLNYNYFFRFIPWDYSTFSRKVLQSNRNGLKQWWKYEFIRLYSFKFKINRLIIPGL